MEPEPESQAESVPRATASSSRGQHARPKAAAKKALARRQPGRFKLGLGLIGMGNNPMVGATVACAVAVEEALK